MNKSFASYSPSKREYRLMAIGVEKERQEMIENIKAHDSDEIILEWHDCYMNIEDVRVYCTHCKYFRISKDEVPYCKFQNECDIFNCEDDAPLNKRPKYVSAE